MKVSAQQFVLEPGVTNKTAKPNTKEVKYSNKYIYIFIRFVYYIGGSACDPPNCAAGSPQRRTNKYYIFYVLFRDLA